jgi:hypothetical protein
MIVVRWGVGVAVSAKREAARSRVEVTLST